MRRTTIRELGQQLPIGFQNGDGKLEKAFSIRPYKARIDRHLGHWREANDGRTQAYLVGKFIAMITAQAGPHILSLTKDGDSTDVSELAVSKWAFADVLYVYVWTRIQELDPFLILPFKCPVCSHFGTAKFDLRDSDVAVAESVEELEHWVDLRKGMELRDGTTVKRIKLQPITWAALYNIGAGGGQLGSHDYVQIQHSIKAVEGHDYYTPLVQEIDTLHKIDMLIIDRAANKVSAGLDLETTVNCPKKDEDGDVCGFEITRPLDWEFDYFFDTSFQSETSPG